jgi:hypothetical protein
MVAPFRKVSDANRSGIAMSLHPAILERAPLITLTRVNHDCGRAPPLALARRCARRRCRVRTLTCVNVAHRREEESTRVGR